MRKLLAVSVALFLIGTLCIARAQIALTGVGSGGNGTPISSYVGPGNVLSGALVWAGLRAYNSTYATPGTNPAADICDVATGLTCVTINILSTGKFDTATAQASSSCSVSCNVSKLYDQTGNGLHLAQATNSKRPVLTFNCQNSMPCLTFTRISSMQLVSAGSLVKSQPFAITGVVKRTGSFTGFQTITSDNAEVTWLGFNNVANDVQIFCGAALDQTGATDSAWHAVIAFCNGASSSLYVDALAAVNGNAGIRPFGNSGLGAPVAIGTGSTDALQGTMVEAGVWGSVSSTDAANLISNQRAFWSF